MPKLHTRGTKSTRALLPAGLGVLALALFLAMVLVPRDRAPERGNGYVETWARVVDIPLWLGVLIDVAPACALAGALWAAGWGLWMTGRRGNG